jgi:ATP synthase F1 gamma subunit
MSGKLRLYKEKLDGYKKFYQIVKTIKMVTLAKYRLTVARAKTRDLSMRYTEKCFRVADYSEDALLEAATKVQLYVPISSNRGSCGALNSNTNKYIESVIEAGKKVKLIAVGKKGNDSLSKLFPNEFSMAIIHDMKVPLSFTFAAYVYENSLKVPDVERTEVVYSRFLSAGVQRQAVINIPTFDKFLEQIQTAATSEKDKENNSFANALLSHEEETIRDFYDFHAALAFNHAIVENELSEYAARVVAVEGQLTNIASLQSRTLYLYNKTRQGSITASLIEILSALNAMEGNAAKGVKKKNFWDRA